jgi:hypothetical protein
MTMNKDIFKFTDAELEKLKVIGFETDNTPIFYDDNHYAEIIAKKNYFIVSKEFRLDFEYNIIKNKFYFDPSMFYWMVKGYQNTSECKTFAIDKFEEFFEYVKKTINELENFKKEKKELTFEDRLNIAKYKMDSGQKNVLI